VLSYAERAGIAVLLVLAVAFAIAAITGMLVNRYGQVKAYWFLTAGFIVIGAIAAWGIALMEHQTEARQQKEVKKAMQAATQETIELAPVVLAASMVSTPAGASSALALARFIGRNWPLFVLLGLASGLIWPGSTEAPFSRGAGVRDRYFH
jgi:MFS family permease